MEFVLNESERLLQATAREFLTQHAPLARVREMLGIHPGARQPGTGPAARAWLGDLWQQAAALGWMELALPESAGGAGGGAAACALILEQLGASLTPLPFLETAFLTIPLLVQAGRISEARAVAGGQRRTLPALYEGEPAWQPGGVQMQATLAGGIYRLRGRKRFVPLGDWADSWIVAARTGPEGAGAGAISLFLVTRDQPGLHLAPQAGLDLTHPCGELICADVAVTPAARLGAEGEGGLWLEALAPRVTAAACAEMAGGARRVLDLTCAHVRERHQFGVPVGSFQALQHRLVDMLTAVESMRSAAYWAAATCDLPDCEAAELSLTSSVAKAFCGRAYRQVAESAIQAHGGMGFTWEYDLHLYYRRALALEAMLGSSSFHEDRIAATIETGKALWWG